MLSPRDQRMFATKTELLEVAWKDLSRAVGLAQPWAARFRRAELARQVRAATLLAGERISLDDALAVTLALAPLEASVKATDAAFDALDALRFAAVVERVREPIWSSMELRTLHFMACAYDPSKEPGRFRTGAVWHEGSARPRAYRPAAPEQITGIAEELCDWLNGEGQQLAPAVEAAAAELTVHAALPFRSGSARVARLLHSLVLAQRGALPPELCGTAEMWHTRRAQFEAALGESIGYAYGSSPRLSVFIGFYLDRHLEQAKAARVRAADANERRRVAGAIVRDEQLESWAATALEDALAGIRVRGIVYRREQDLPSKDVGTVLRHLERRGYLEAGRAGTESVHVAGPELLARTRPGSQGGGGPVEIELELDWT